MPESPPHGAGLQGKKGTGRPAVVLVWLKRSGKVKGEGAASVTVETPACGDIRSTG